MRLVAATASLFLLGGCITMRDYAGAYMKVARAPAGVEPFSKFKVRMHRTRKTRQLLSNDKAHSGLAADDNDLHCAWFRNQLYVASIDAQKHTKIIWGVPFVWPWSVATGFYFPITQTLLANEVRETARRIEEAYQTSDDAFIAACNAEKHTSLFETFRIARQAQLAD
jgi:hypothetical protein